MVERERLLGEARFQNIDRQSYERVLRQELQMQYVIDPCGVESESAAGVQSTTTSPSNRNLKLLGKINQH